MNDEDDYKILKRIENLSKEKLLKLMGSHASCIVRNTQADAGSWDDPEDWQIESVELAHAVYKVFRDDLLKE